MIAKYLIIPALVFTGIGVSLTLEANKGYCAVTADISHLPQQHLPRTTPTIAAAATAKKWTHLPTGSGNTATALKI